MGSGGPPSLERLRDRRRPLGGRPARRRAGTDPGGGQTVRRSHKQGAVVLYVGNDFDGRYAVSERSERPLWHRRFLLQPDTDEWVIWQLHGYAMSTASLAGLT